MRGFDHNIEGSGSLSTYSVVGQILVAKEPDLLYYCESFECTLNALVVVSGDLVQVRGQHYNVLCMSYESCQL